MPGAGSTDASRNFVVVGPRETDIHEGRVRAQAKDQLDGRGTIGRLVHVVAVQFEQQVKRLPRVCSGDDIDGRDHSDGEETGRQHGAARQDPGRQDALECRPRGGMNA